MALDELTRHSVTRREVEQASVTRIMIAPAFADPLVSIPYDPPAYWSPDRDVTLRRAFRMDGLWSSAVHIALTRLSSLGYEVDGDIGLRVKRAKESLDRDWVGLLQRFGRAFLTCDNGGFIEVVRATQAAASRVLGFVHLSSARCIRTGNVETPVLYVDRTGRYHELRAHQVAEFSDLPDEDFYGVGLCSTSRAYDAIYEHIAVASYFKERVTGRRPTELHIVSGMGQQAIEQGLRAAHEDASAKGLVSYMGAAIVANPNATDLKVETIPFMSLPPGYDQEKHEELTQVRYADALGIDPVELNPRLIGNRALGAGSQAQVLDEKQSSKGMVALRQQLMHFFNDTERWHPLPNAVTFAWSERDLRDQKAKAEISKTRADVSASRIGAGITTAAQELQVQVDDGELPVEFLKTDQTPDETLTDEDKAEFSEEQGQDQGGEQPEAPVASATPTVPIAPIAPVQVVQKEVSDDEVTRLFEAELEAARKLYRSVPTNGRPRAFAVPD
ncbi:MAG: hypothetical protein IT323_13470 [Anaerolineae bacterium]|nr:hypothetical protein [Anaerolineae bacterium]